MPGIDSFAKLVLHADGSDTSTTFTDSSPDNLSTTAVNSNCQLDTAQFKFGSASILFDGTDDYFRYNGEAGFIFGTGDWTIDFQIRLNTTGIMVILADWRSANGLFPCIYISSGNVLIYHTNNGNRITGTTTLTTGTWYHVAVARSGTSTKLFLNGTQEGSTYTDSHDYSVGTGRPVFGTNGTLLTSNEFNGWMDEIRVSKGIARWTANFTAPSAAYSLDDGVLGSATGVATAAFYAGSTLTAATGVAAAAFSGDYGFADIEETATGNSAVDGTGFTFNAVAIGSLGANDTLYFGFGTRHSGGTPTVASTTLTVDGVSADLIASNNPNSGGTGCTTTLFAIKRYQLPDPSQTDVDLVLTYTASQLRCAYFAARGRSKSKVATGTDQESLTGLLGDQDFTLQANTVADSIALTVMMNGGSGGSLHAHNMLTGLLHETTNEVVENARASMMMAGELAAATPFSCSVRFDDNGSGIADPSVILATFGPDTDGTLASAGVATASFAAPTTIVVPTCSGYVPEVGADTFTLGNAYIGEAIGDRSLLVLVSMAQGGDTSTIPSAATYGGAGLTKIFDYNTTSGVCFSFSVWRLDDPTGTNADIVVTSAGAPSRVMLVSAFACYGLGALLDSATDDALTGSALDLSLNTELGGAVFALMGRYNNSNGSGGNWSVDFANERKALQFRGPFQEDGCSFDLAASTQTPRTVTATINNASGSLSGVGGIAVSFSPGASGLEAP